MADYQKEQDIFMREMEIEEKRLGAQEIEATIAGIDTPLRRVIVSHLRAHKQFADLTARECFERWKAGYRGNKVAAIKLLQAAHDQQNIEADF